ncbi:MAG TPA: prevent-host-death protein [Clostridiales bacterium]|nr:prevent-host-death protein [Clostridiales bacterium]
MIFFTIRDMRSNPRQIWERIAAGDEVIITNNGKPAALMIEVNDKNLQDTLLAIRQAQAIRAVNRLRVRSVQTMPAGMSSEEIEAEIQAARKELTHD